ncbi:non-hydrolyzing UDP-N-acetylglucosamine 2-epimerase [Castellaniella sp.]|uniref:non-hydrolyzing UDP-N-acetylglucosamine 2-epimerase n=1 Tax=Castellaniella sp. TaxID=1955812 RepID=UPI002AFE1EF7|nr:UDP-N-acetylglucosamine 2-epimerase (non-hydrolyzing) [Castellaniella sp.]
MKVLSIFGTRPEAIKMAPLVQAIQQSPTLQSVVCVTGQHREMLNQVTSLFGLQANHDLHVMVPNQTLNGLFGRTLERLDTVLTTESPDLVLVHGDTTTACAAAMASFHRGIAVGHIEAGLRTGDLRQPFPEEMNRRVIDSFSQWLFAPTAQAAANLAQENLSGQVLITGNTVIDALAWTCAILAPGSEHDLALCAKYPWLNPDKRLILVTGHRRENFGHGFDDICTALAALAARQDVQIVYPVHLNPKVRDVVMARLGQLPAIRLIDPLAYLDFVWFMQHAHLILTDSGGVQEEAPYLGKPVLVMREVTERPEAVDAGTVVLVGTSPQRIQTEVERLLDNAAHHASFCRRINPYGDGHASARIVAALAGESVNEFQAPPQH